MTRVKSQIQHDYKTLVKPDRQNHDRPIRGWFFVGLGIPVALVALVLLFSPGGESQTARAAIAQTSKSVGTSPAPVVADVALETPAAIPETPPPVTLKAVAPPEPDPSEDEQKIVAIALPSSAAGKPTEVFTDAAQPAPTPVAASAPQPVLTLAAPAAATAPPADVESARSAPHGGGRPLALPVRSATAALTDAERAPELPGQPLTLTIKKGDTLDELFDDNNLSRTDLANILAIKDAKQALSLLMPGDKVDLRHQDNRISYLTRPLDEVRTLHVTRGDDGFTSHVTEVPVEVRIAHASATINSSLFLAAKAAGISDKLTMNLAGVFAWDIDFVLDIRKGDRFSVIYEEVWQNGEHLRDGQILAAMFENDGDEFKALRYVDPDDNVGYFTPDGVNVKKAFLRAPIKFTPRVTSNFNPNRMHPVHKRRRPHQGVDYGAPTGTPIIAAGDGKVIFRGRKGGYGNTVILQHGGNITTLYAHMSKFVGKVRSGSRVSQGQTIGYVGATGTVTARHLHYEYRVNGVHRNPRTVSLPKAKPIPKKFVANFKSTTQPLLNQLNVVSRDTRVAMIP